MQMQFKKKSKMSRSFRHKQNRTHHWMTDQRMWSPTKKQHNGFIMMTFFIPMIKVLVNALVSPLVSVTGPSWQSGVVF